MEVRIIGKDELKLLTITKHVVVGHTICKHNLCNPSSEHRGLPTINLRGNVVIIPHMEAWFRFYREERVT